MKNILSLRHRLLPLVILLLGGTTLVSAQVPTKFLRSAAELEQHMPWLFVEEPSEYLAEVPEQSDALFTVASTENAPSLGTPQPLSLTQEDGTFYDFDTYTVWKLPVYAPGAKSLTLIMAGVNLPERSQLVVYSRETAMYHGPVTARELVADSYFCDLIVGERATIEVVMPLSAKEEFTIVLPGYLFGTEDKTSLLRNGKEVVADGNN